MKMLRSAELSKLLSAQPGPCLSMYVSTEEPHKNSHLIRKKWQETIDEADSRINQKYTKHRARFLLEPLRSMPELLSKPPPDTKGVALFRSFTTAGFYPIKESTPQLMAVSDTFHLKPLLKLIQQQERYFALALNQRRVSLYQGSASGSRLVASYQADYHGSNKRDRRNKVTVPRGRAGRDTVVQFRPMKRVSRFLEMVEPHVWNYLRGETNPLILLGTPFMHSLYRNMNCYPHVSEKGVLASLPHQRAVIHERAWPIARQELLSREQKLVGQFYEAKHRGQTSEEPAAIAKACLQGRIRTLLVSREASLFGLLDRDTGRILPKQSKDRLFGDDVLDDIAQEVILRKGTVYVLDAEAMPESSILGAIFRW